MTSATVRVVGGFVFSGIFVVTMVSIMDYAPWSTAVVESNQCKSDVDALLFSSFFLASKSNPVYQTTSGKTAGKSKDGRVSASLDLSLWNLMAVSNNKYGTRLVEDTCIARVSPRGASEADDSSIFGKRDRLINTGELFSGASSSAYTEFVDPVETPEDYMDVLARPLDYLTNDTFRDSIIEMGKSIERGGPRVFDSVRTGHRTPASDKGNKEARLEWVDLATCKKLGSKKKNKEASVFSEIIRQQASFARGGTVYDLMCEDLGVLLKSPPSEFQASCRSIFRNPTRLRDCIGSYEVAHQLAGIATLQDLLDLVGDSIDVSDPRLEEASSAVLSQVAIAVSQCAQGGLPAPVPGIPTLPKVSASKPSDEAATGIISSLGDIGPRVWDKLFSAQFRRQALIPDDRGVGIQERFEKQPVSMEPSLPKELGNRLLGTLQRLPVAPGDRYYGSTVVAVNPENNFLYVRVPDGTAANAAGPCSDLSFSASVVFLRTLVARPVVCSLSSSKLPEGSGDDDVPVYVLFENIYTGDPAHDPGAYYTAASVPKFEALVQACTEKSIDDCSGDVGIAEWEGAHCAPVVDSYPWMKAFFDLSDGYRRDACVFWMDDNDILSRGFDSDSVDGETLAGTSCTPSQAWEDAVRLQLLEESEASSLEFECRKGSLSFPPSYCGYRNPNKYYVMLRGNSGLSRPLSIYSESETPNLWSSAAGIFLASEHVVTTEFGRSLVGELFNPDVSSSTYERVMCQFATTEATCPEGNPVTARSPISVLDEYFDMGEKSHMVFVSDLSWFKGASVGAMETLLHNTMTPSVDFVGILEYAKKNGDLGGEELLLWLEKNSFDKDSYNAVNAVATSDSMTLSLTRASDYRRVRFRLSLQQNPIRWCVVDTVESAGCVPLDLDSGNTYSLESSMLYFTNVDLGPYSFYDEKSGSSKRRRAISLGKKTMDILSVKCPAMAQSQQTCLMEIDLHNDMPSESAIHILKNSQIQPALSGATAEVVEVQVTGSKATVSVKVDTASATASAMTVEDVILALAGATVNAASGVSMNDFVASIPEEESKCFSVGTDGLCNGVARAGSDESHCRALATQCGDLSSCDSTATTSGDLCVSAAGGTCATVDATAASQLAKTFVECAPVKSTPTAPPAGGADLSAPVKEGTTGESRQRDVPVRLNDRTNWKASAAACVPYFHGIEEPLALAKPLGGSQADAGQAQFDATKLNHRQLYAVSALYSGKTRHYYDRLAPWVTKALTVGVPIGLQKRDGIVEQDVEIDAYPLARCKKFLNRLVLDTSDGSGTRAMCRKLISAGIDIDYKGQPVDSLDPSPLLLDAYYAKRVSDFGTRRGQDEVSSWYETAGDKSKVSPWQFVNDLFIVLAEEGMLANYTVMFDSLGVDPVGDQASLFNAPRPGPETVLGNAQEVIRSYSKFAGTVTLNLFTRGADMMSVVDRAFREAMIREIGLILDHPVSGGRQCEEYHDIQPVVVVAQVSAILFAAVCLRMALAYTCPAYKSDIRLIGGGDARLGDTALARGSTMLFFLGVLLGALALCMWYVFVHPAFEDVVSVQEAAEQNRYKDAVVGSGGIMFIVAYGVYTVASIVWVVFLNTAAEGKKTEFLPANVGSDINKSRKSIYFSNITNYQN